MGADGGGSGADELWRVEMQDGGSEFGDRGSGIR